MKRNNFYLLFFLFVSTAIMTGMTGCKKGSTCDRLACQHGGYCNSDTCACPPGYVGALCQYFSACDTINCLNGGACTNGHCLCPDGYEGPRCASTIRDRFLGSYKGPLTSNPGSTTTTTITITAGTGSAWEIKVPLIQGIATLKGDVDKSGSINFPSQSAALSTFSGSGMLSGNTLTFSVVQVAFGTVNINWSFTGVKQ